MVLLSGKGLHSSCVICIHIFAAKQLIGLHL